MISTLRTSFSRFNYRLYLTLICRLLFPTIYVTFRVSLLGSLPDANSLSIAAQMQWINLLLEVIEEGLLQPLYHCLGQSISDDAGTKNKTKTGFLTCTVVFSLFSALISATARPLVTFMGQEEALIDETVSYIRLELVAIIGNGLGRFLMVLMVMRNWNLPIYISLTAQMATSMTLDYLLASEKVANLGATGVALSSIGTSVVVLAVNSIICSMKLKFVWADFRSNWDFSWFRRWTRVGIFFVPG